MCHLLRALVVVPLCCAAMPVRGADKTEVLADRRLVIRPVADAVWGGRIQDVEKVLDSAAQTLWPYFPGRSLPPILVEPKGGPICLFRRGPNGEYLVRLNTGDRRWAQHAFQFAHEFGHILANYDQHERHNKWLEESICEMASLFALRRMGESWKVRPPYPNWKEYAPALSRYADGRLRNARLPSGESLAGWYRANERLLRQEPCDRDKTTIVAAALLPLFEERPESWEAIGWLNDGTPHGERTFKKYLADWHDRAGAKQRPTVRRIAQQFAIEVLPTR